MRGESGEAGRRELGIAELRVHLEGVSSPDSWDNRPGIEFWESRVTLTYDGSPDLPAATLAVADLTRVDLSANDDFVFELDSISHDLGDIAAAMLDGEDKLDEYGLYQGSNASVLIAEAVTVDRFWRGIRLGPATVLHAADALSSNAVVLYPAALQTRVREDGVCVTVSGAPRPGPEVQEKVRTTWRRAGFRQLANGVLWYTEYDGFGDRKGGGPKARRVLTRVQKTANQPRAKNWWRRRVARQGTRPTP